MKIGWYSSGWPYSAENRYRLIGGYLRSKGHDCFKLNWWTIRKPDVVVILKTVDISSLKLTGKCLKRGVRVIFDANVNYYEDSDVYGDARERPTIDQMGAAWWMTANASFVVADSAYLGDVCRDYNKNVVVIPDPVDIERYKPFIPPVKFKGKLKLIWVGVDWKSYHLDMIQPVMDKYKGQVEVLKVMNFNGAVGPEVFRGFHAVVSPKYLRSGYDKAHTEHKISLGMACGLPAICSPQQSYVEAVGGGGWICNDLSDWDMVFDGLLKGTGEALRESGDRAREQIVKNYSPEILGERYANVIENLL